MILKIFRVIGWICLCIIIGICIVFLYNTQFIESKDSVASAPANTSFVDIGSEKLAYTEKDNRAGTTVMFIGGLSAWGGTWERVIEEVHKKDNRFNYVAIDLPPFGYSVPDSTKGYMRDVQAQRIADLIENKKIKDVIIVAHSYGAGPAMEYAMNHQERVKKFIVIDGVLAIDQAKSQPSTAVQIDFLRNIVVGTLVHNTSFSLYQLKKFVYITTHINTDLLSVYTRYLNTKGASLRLSAWLEDYTNDPLAYKSNDSTQYKNITFPVRLIWGDKDTITPISETVVLLKNIPDVRLVTLEGVGHIPMIEDHVLFDTALLDVLYK